MTGFKSRSRWAAPLLAGGLCLAAAAPGTAQTAAQAAGPALSLAEQIQALNAKPAPAKPAATAAPGAGVEMGAGAAPTATGPLLADGPSQVRQSAAALAQGLPQEHRALMTEAYEKAFGAWKQLEAQAGIAPNDLAAAAAAFIAGSYGAYVQHLVSDDDFRVLVRQMQGLLGRSPGFTGLSPASRRKLYEQLSMSGMFMALYREKLRLNPNPAEDSGLRQSAKVALEKVLGIGIERIQLGPQGMVVR